MKTLLNIDGIGETQIKSLEKFFQNKINIKVVEKLNKILKIKDRKINKKGKLKINLLCLLVNFKILVEQKLKV